MADWRVYTGTQRLQIGWTLALVATDLAIQVLLPGLVVGGVLVYGGLGLVWLLGLVGLTSRDQRAWRRLVDASTFERGTPFGCAPWYPIPSGLRVTRSRSPCLTGSAGSPSRGLPSVGLAALDFAPFEPRAGRAPRPTSLGRPGPVSNRTEGMSRVVDLTAGDSEGAEILERTGSGGVIGSAYLHDRPLASYIAEEEAVMYVLRNKKSGLEVDGGADTASMAPDDDHQAFAVVTDVRLLFVVGSADGDRVQRLPFADVLTAGTASGGFRTTVLRIETQDDAVVTFPVRGDVEAVAEYVDRAAQVWAHAARTAEEAVDAVSTADRQIDAANYEAAQHAVAGVESALEAALSDLRGLGQGALTAYLSTAEDLVDDVNGVRRRAHAGRGGDAHATAQTAWENRDYEAAAGAYGDCIGAFAAAYQCTGDEPPDQVIRRRAHGAAREREVLRSAPLIDLLTAKHRATAERDPATAAETWERALEFVRDLSALSWPDSDDRGFRLDSRTVREHAADCAEHAIDNRSSAARQWMSAGDRIAEGTLSAEATEAYERARIHLDRALALARELFPGRLDDLEASKSALEGRLSGAAVPEPGDHLDAPLPNEPIEALSHEAAADTGTDIDAEPARDEARPADATAEPADRVAAEGPQEAPSESPDDHTPAAASERTEAAHETDATESGQAEVETADAEPDEMEPEEGEPAEAETAEAETADAEPADPEPEEGEPAEAETVHGEPDEVDPAESEPAEAETADAEPDEVEPKGGEPAEAETADAEPAEPEPAESEPAEAETAAAEPAEPEPEGSEPAEAEAVDAEPDEVEPKGGEPAEAGTADAEPAEPEPAESDPAEAETADAEPDEVEPEEGETAEAETADAEPAEPEPAESEPAEAESADAEPDEVEPEEGEPAEAETAASTDSEPTSDEPTPPDPLDGDWQVPRTGPPPTDESAGEIGDSSGRQEPATDAGGDPDSSGPASSESDPTPTTDADRVEPPEDWEWHGPPGMDDEADGQPADGAEESAESGDSVDEPPPEETGETDEGAEPKPGTPATDDSDLEETTKEPDEVEEVEELAESDQTVTAAPDADDSDVEAAMEATAESADADEAEAEEVGEPGEAPDGTASVSPDADDSDVEAALEAATEADDADEADAKDESTTVSPDADDSDVEAALEEATELDEETEATEGTETEAEAADADDEGDTSERDADTDGPSSDGTPATADGTAPDEQGAEPQEESGTEGPDEQGAEPQEESGTEGPDEATLRRRLRALDEGGFTDLVADLWEERGWSTMSFSAAGGSVYDLVAVRGQPEGERLLLWTDHRPDGGTVPVRVVERIEATRERSEGAEALALVTSGRLTSEGRDRAEAAEVDLYDAEAVVDALVDAGMADRLLENGD